jgi:hypothetical protein
MYKSLTEKYFIWHIQGGLGKNVAATSLLPTLKQMHPDRNIIIVASYPQVFLNNPYIYRVYNSSNLIYFYEDYIKNKDTIICNQEPYNQTGHILKKHHLLQSWCELLNIEYQDQPPQLFYNYAEQKLYKQNKSPKPTLLLHTNGGLLTDNSNYNWVRDIPIEFSRVIVDKYSLTHNIIHITREKGYRLDHPSVTRIDKFMPSLELFSILQNTNKRILIDSCLQHAAAALNLPSTVLWIGTSPTLFGYKMHKNVISKPPKIANQLIDSYLFDYQFLKNEYQCPYMNSNEIFDLNIINEL